MGSTSDDEPIPVPGSRRHISTTPAGQSPPMQAHQLGSSDLHQPESHTAVLPTDPAVEGEAQQADAAAPAQAIPDPVGHYGASAEELGEPSANGAAQEAPAVEADAHLARGIASEDVQPPASLSTEAAVHPSRPTEVKHSWARLSFIPCLLSGSPDCRH